MYDVEVKVLNQAVKRNAERFPPDFMFQLTRAEAEDLRSQIVTSTLAAAVARAESDSQPTAITRVATIR